jgi:hypothetical protein
MSTLEQEVRSTIESFMKNGELFTALDVSNVVKQSLPFARHREVRDIVRALYASDMQTAGYARTPIAVILEDQTTAEALLYHPVSDTWNLDAKYDDQKRAQASMKPLPALNIAPTPVTAVTPVTVPVVQAVVAPTVTPVVAAPAPLARDQWNAMFNSAPSLFPRK